MPLIRSDTSPQSRKCSGFCLPSFSQAAKLGFFPTVQINFPKAWMLGLENALWPLSHHTQGLPQVAWCLSASTRRRPGPAAQFPVSLRVSPALPAGLHYSLSVSHPPAGSDMCTQAHKGAAISSSPASVVG